MNIYIILRPEFARVGHLEPESPAQAFLPSAQQNKLDLRLLKTLSVKKERVAGLQGKLGVG